MAHLTMDFTKYQMYSYIIPTYVENFIKNKQSWSPIQPPRLPEIESKIYIPSSHIFIKHLHWMCYVDNTKIMAFWTVFFFKNFSLVWLLNLAWICNHTWIKFVRLEPCPCSCWCIGMKVCKFWIWPLVTYTAVAEAMIAWSQWNFQQRCVRYQSTFGIY